MDPLKAHPTTYATHELEDARARIRRELSRRQAAQAADAAEDFPRPQSAYHRAKRDLFGALYSGAPSTHTHASAGTHLDGVFLDLPMHGLRNTWRAAAGMFDVPEDAPAAEEAPDQPAAGPEEQGPGVDAPFQPHEVRYAATIPTRAECSCQGWHWHGDLGAVALNSYAEHLRLAWGC